MQLAFSPFLPLPLLIGAIVIVALVAGAGYFARLKGTTLRALSGLLIIAALANPTLSSEERSPLPTIVPVVVDRSQSQKLGERQKQSDAALAALQKELEAQPLIEPRIIDVPTSEENGSASTRAFTALADAIRDVPQSRLGGAIFITDGEIDDIPDNNTLLGDQAPLSALITGKPDEFDRRIAIDEAPRFGLVGDDQSIAFRVIDDGAIPADETAAATVTARVNGDVIATMRVRPGEPTTLTFNVPNGGSNIIELSVDPIPGELSNVNNRAVETVEGIRENLRVLLVSGSPHAGERTWRNLLKSDASVDLVHFTILRPPEKQDGTPINELSLIAFPTRELFNDKIDDFDLIILDRYQNRGVLPLLYYDNIAQYVRKGGALLVAAGPEIAGPESIAATPLSSVLPAIPSGNVATGGYYPELSDLGRKHPVTRDLPGSASTPPDWGRWFRAIDVSAAAGETVMTADGKPLLVLDKVGDGRVAELLSDQGWLWARGFEGGGPYAQLYRRIAHWLMKEPALEDEALTAKADGRHLTVTRQTMGAAPGPAIIHTPTGATIQLPLDEAEPGLYRGETDLTETGLFTIDNGDLERLINIGDPNAPEFRAMISTTQTLSPLSAASNGITTRLSPDGAAISVPPLRIVSGALRAPDGNAIPVHMTSDTVLKSIHTLPLFAGFLGIALLLLALSASWWREGRR
ncbi:hypothetical protein FJU08_08175 [Martelella alba]|uniref:Glutamine amidotransferase domain-containing protein n=1 Tax=Martelella alba TaxID=2590451 RepID=A0A506UEV9_9HYPH|nr:hypothetical protein [Martelella alba]TPW31711.1 hypothetical protein FJU08_08175 [Martelella alba]